jgi:N-acetylmuramoyl-L-alanine amidase
MRDIDKLIVHCSATPNDRDVTVEEIRDWHVNGNGWDDIGYHYVIYRNGAIMSGRPVYKSGAHCKGQNANSIGVCLIGDDVFTDEQFDSLKKIHSMLGNIFIGIEAFGHRDFTDKKTCPNFEVKDYIES